MPDNVLQEVVEEVTIRYGGWCACTGTLMERKYINGTISVFCMHCKLVWVTVTQKPEID